MGAGAYGAGQSLPRVVGVTPSWSGGALPRK